jgi:hypothetical protein
MHNYQTDPAQLHFDAVWRYEAIQRPVGRPSFRKDGPLFRGVLVYDKRVVWSSPTLASMARLAIRNAKRAC